MYSEIFYVSKMKFKRDFILMIISYFIIMFLVPCILNKLNVARVIATSSSWSFIGNANLAFIILFLAEFILGIILGVILVNPYIYYVIMLCSFIIKLILFFLISGLLWFFSFFSFISLTYNIEFLLYRFVMSINAYNGLFFIPTMLCFATFFGIQIGMFIKNKQKTKELERRIYASSNR